MTGKTLPQLCMYNKKLTSHTWNALYKAALHVAWRVAVLAFEREELPSTDKVGAKEKQMKSI